MPRKKKLTTSLIESVEELAAKGLFDRQICASLRLSHDTFYRYLRESKEFRDALDRGRGAISDEIENALVRRAMGYDAEESLIVSRVNKDGSVSISEIRKSKKHVPPETAAIAFWLKNKRPKIWKDRHDLDIGGNIIVKLNEDEMDL